MRNRFTRSIPVLFALVAGSVFGQTADRQWVPVKIDSSTLLTLSAEEKTEQLRDWALISAVVSTGPKAETYRDLLYRFSPLRLDLVRPLFDQRAGKDRWVALPGGLLLVLVPEGKSNDLVRIGRLADDYTVSVGHRPKEATVFEYRIDDQAAILAIRPADETSGTVLYSTAAGFEEAVVRTAADLARFLAANLDLIEASRRPNGLYLGGRKLGADIPQLMDISDLAAMKTAADSLIQTVTEHMRRSLPQIYEQRVDEVLQELISKHADDFSTASFADLQKLRALIYDKNPFDKFERVELDGAIKANPPTIGFSLDPRQNYSAIADDLQLLIDRPKKLFDGKLLNSYAANFQSAAKLETEQVTSALSKAKAGAHSSFGPEKHFLTLVGLEKPAPPSASGENNWQSELLSSFSINDDEALDEARQSLDQIALSAKSKKDELLDVIAGLRAGKSDPWYALQRYLDGEAFDVLIREDSPKYQIRDLQVMLQGIDEGVAADGSFGRKTREAVKKFQEEYNEEAEEKLKENGVVDAPTWRALLQLNEDKAQELESLRLLLHDIEVKNNRQCARYDGALQGTEVGMTLFYTDLLMKLWSFSYQNQQPDVKGFIPETKFPVDPVYWEEIRKYPSTRGWLGGKVAGLSYDDGGDTIRFAPVATRLYDASSNPLLNGKEVQPNFSSKRFSSWWNAHYWEVANYEPQYHRLNQIMKWSAVIGSFKDNPPAAINTVGAQPYVSNLRFNEWWPTRNDLKVHAQVPFFQVTGERTECMAILQSDLFEGMGGIGMFSGGVSTFGEADLAIRKLSDARRSLISETARQSAVDYNQSAEVGKIVVPNEGEFDLRSPNKAHFAPDPRMQTGFGSPGLQERGYLQSLDTAFSGGESQVSVSAQAGPTKLYDVSVRNNAGAMQIDARTSDFVSALGFVKAENRADGADWLRVELKGGFLLKRNDSHEWTLFTSDPRSIAGNKSVSVKVAIDKRVYTATSVTEVEAQGKMQGTGWVEIPSAAAGGDGGGRNDPTILVVTGPEKGDRDFTLLIGDTRRKARQGDEGIMVAAGPEEAQVIRGQLDGDDAAAFSVLVSTRGRRSSARKIANGQVAYAAFASAPDDDFATLAPLVAATGRERTTIAVRDTPGGGVRFAPDGSLELPVQSRQEDLATAKHAIEMASTLPDLRPAFYKLGDIQPADLANLNGASMTSAEAYIEFKSVDLAKLSGIGLLDLRIAADSKQAAFRTTTRIGFLTMDDSEAVQRSYDYVQGLLTQPDRPDTVAEFREKSRALFDYIKKASLSLGTPKIVTLESGNFDMDAFVLLHGGIPGVRFVRDIPNLSQSLDHVARPVEASPSKSVILSTVPLNDLECKTCGPAQESVRKMKVYLPDFDTELTWSRFRMVLADTDFQQITLVARTAGQGIAFSNQWVGAADISKFLKYSFVRPKQLLHLITNGDSSIVGAFADSGKFDRVVLSRFQEGRIESFARAIGELSMLSAASGPAMVHVTPEDLASLRSEEGTDLAHAIDEVQQRLHTVDVPLSDVIIAIERVSPQQALPQVKRNRDWLRGHIVGQLTVNLDQLLDTELEDLAKAENVGSRKAALELGALPLIKN